MIGGLRPGAHGVGLPVSIVLPVSPINWIIQKQAGKGLHVW